MLAQHPDFAIYIYSSDAFTHLLEKMCEILDKISHRRKVIVPDTLLNIPAEY